MPSQKDWHVSLAERSAHSDLEISVTAENCGVPQGLYARGAYADLRVFAGLSNNFIFMMPVCADITCDMPGVHRAQHEQYRILVRLALYKCGQNQMGM